MAESEAVCAPEPLGGEDLAILLAESGTVAGHTLKIAILKPPPNGPRPDLEGVRARIAARIDRAPRLRRRVQLRSRRRAAWVDDPSFDVRYHVRSLPVSSAVSDDGLRRVCACMMQQRLDRSRPLWKIDLLDPLEGDRIGLIWSLHHSIADGAVAVQLAQALLWDDDDAAKPRVAGAERPGALADLREALGARRPARLPGTLRRELRRAATASPFDGVVGTERAVAFTSVRLSIVKDAAARLVPGATVNDAVLAIVGGGLRRWAEGRGEPLGTVRVRVPVSLHHHGESIATANRNSFFCVALPLAEPDPVERLRRISRETAIRKRAGDSLVIDTLLRDVGHLAPPLRRVLDRITLHPRAFALNVSSVIGPVRRPSLLGAAVRAFYSVADIDQWHGLRVAGLSMADAIYFGLCADPEIVGSLDPLVEGMLAEAASLERGR